MTVFGQNKYDIYIYPKKGEINLKKILSINALQSKIKSHKLLKKWTIIDYYFFLIEIQKQSNWLP